MNACFDIFLLDCFKKLYLEQFEAKVYVSLQHVVHVSARYLKYVYFIFKSILK